MYVKDFFTLIRGRLKDADDDDTATLQSIELGRATRDGIRKIQTMFPETRLDIRGRLSALEATAYTEDTAAVQVDGDYPTVPLPPEFEPALEAFVLAWVYGREAQDAKDESLMRHWENKFRELTGLPARR